MRGSVEITRRREVGESRFFQSKKASSLRDEGGKRRGESPGGVKGLDRKPCFPVGKVKRECIRRRGPLGAQRT